MVCFCGITVETVQGKALMANINFGSPRAALLEYTVVKMSAILLKGEYS